MTALVPSDTACLASSPGRISRTLHVLLAGGLDDIDPSVYLRGLDLSGRDGRLLVVGSKLGSLGGNPLEDVVDERVQDGHGTVGDTSVRVDLLEDWSGS